MKIHKTNLQAEFHADHALTRYMRNKASKILRESRKLRCKDRTDEADELMKRAVRMRRSACGDREIALALAFLNNTPYEKCEAKCRTAPNIANIAVHVANCLPSDWGGRMSLIIERWVEGGVLRMLDSTGDMQNVLDIKEVQNDLKAARLQAERATGFHSGHRRLREAENRKAQALKQIQCEEADKTLWDQKIQRLEENLQKLMKKKDGDDGPMWGLEKEAV